MNLTAMAGKGFGNKKNKRNFANSNGGCHWGNIPP